MTTNLLLLTTIERINRTRKITRADQLKLTATLVDHCVIPPDQSSQIQNICDRLAKGLIQLVD